MLQHCKEMDIPIPNAMAWYWWVSWVIIDPLILLFVTVLAWANFPGDFFLDYTFPFGVEVLRVISCELKVEN